MDDKFYCGKSECHGHGDYSVCGKPYRENTRHQCDSCKLMNLQITCGQQAVKIAAYEAAQQQPAAYIFMHPSGRLFWQLSDPSCAGTPGVVPVYFGAENPGPTVTPPTQKEYDDLQIFIEQNIED